MAKYAPPVPARTGIYLLATAGIGIVAAATDLVAVRLRRPALAGLPLLVLFCVPLTTDAHPSGLSAAVVFSLGIAGYLALLSADGRERVRLWGRIVHTWPGKPETRGPDTRQLTAAGRRVGFAAVVLALCVPLILPALRHHRLFPSSGTGKGPGHVSSLALPDPLVEMNQDLRIAHPETVLTYRTNATSRPPYFQVYVLGRLGTSAWSLTSPTATAAVGGVALPAVPGLSPSTSSFTVRETITLSSTLRLAKHAVSYLPLPYAPRSATVPGNWRVDENSLSILSTTTSLAGLQYSVTSRNIDPSPQQLRRAGVPPPAEDGYLAVPQPYRRLLPITKRITAGHESDYSKAVALQEWFTEPGNFTYSLTAAQPNGASGLMTFLTKTKRGYCQQFAFAMAVMARLVGIPSRVVVGYTQGVHQANDTWLVRTSDAHAWPELYFQGAGWLRFEPTPSGAPGQAGGQATAVAPAYSIPPLGSIVPTPKPSSSVRPSARPSSSASAGGIGSKDRQLSGTGGTGRAAAATLPVLLLILVVLAVATVTPRAARTITRRRRWLMAGDDTGRAHAAWLEFRDDLTDHRIACRASESPRALAHRIGESLGLAAADRQALARIALAEERARYARTPVGSAQLRSDVATARRAVAQASGLAARCAAMAFPASVLAPARAALTHVLDVFGWMDVISTSLQHRASGRRAPAAHS